MIPPYVSIDNPSRAEVRLFEKMRDELSNDWVVLHSLGLVLHPKKPWSEIDFVLIGPQGSLLPRSQGAGAYRVKMEFGISLTSRWSPSREDRRPLLNKVGSASAALYAYIRRERPGILQLLTGFGVAMPDILPLKSPVQILMCRLYTMNPIRENHSLTTLSVWLRTWAVRLGKPSSTPLYARSTDPHWSPFFEQTLS